MIAPDDYWMGRAATAANGKGDYTMRRLTKIPRWWSAELGLTPLEAALLAAAVLLLALSGCGTTPSPSACPTPFAPGELMAPVPNPIPLESSPKPPSKTSPPTASSATR